MIRSKASRTIKTVKKDVASRIGDKYLFRLYVAGTSTRSRQAILRVRELCAGELKGRSKLEVIDIYQEPERARTGQIIATPTLVQVLPTPVRRLIGTPTTSSRWFVGYALGATGR